MKKALLFTLLLSVSLMTSGCMKNYSTVSEYSAAMTVVKNKLQDYTIDATIASASDESTIKSYTKSNEKWKTEISTDNGKTYNSGILYDGNEVLTYDTNTKIAMVLPFLDSSLKNNETKDIASSVVKLLNPVGILFSWNYDAFGLDNVDKDWKFVNITKKNNFQCRLIQSQKSDNEVCVNDKYGIAVYAKYTDPKKKQTVIINVKSIDNKPIPDSEIQLPPGIKKQSLEDLFNSMADKFKNIDKSMPTKTSDKAMEDYARNFNKPSSLPNADVDE